MDEFMKKYTSSLLGRGTQLVKFELFDLNIINEFSCIFAFNGETTRRELMAAYTLVINWEKDTVFAEKWTNAHLIICGCGVIISIKVTQDNIDLNWRATLEIKTAHRIVIKIGEPREIDIIYFTDRSKTDETNLLTVETRCLDTCDYKKTEKLII